MNNTVTPEEQHRLMFEMEEDFFWFKSLRENEIYFINKIFRNRKKESIRILDAGCGTGYLVYELKKLGYDAIGIDYSDTAVELCQKRGLKLNYDIFHMDILDLHFEKEIFDCIISNDVLFAFDINESKDIVRGLLKFLKKDGVFIGQTAAFQFLYSQSDLVAGTKYRYTKKEIKEILCHNKLEIVKLSYRNFIMFIPLVLSRLSNKKQVPKENAKSALVRFSRFSNFIMNKIFSIDNFFLRYINYCVGGTVFWVVRKKV